jgi:hypothetical protein
MSVKRVVQLESWTVVSEPVRIPFDFANLSSLPKGKSVKNSIVITPITVRTWFELKPLLMSFDRKDLKSLTSNGENPGFDAEILELMSKHDAEIFDIICIGIHNKKGHMPDWFREVLRDNCTWEDMYILLNAIFFRIGCNPFMNSITALRAVSPLSEEEIIALQENRESWNRKAASCSLSSPTKPSDTATSRH